MRILVTGCAGFVGWKTAELLLEEGHEVVGLDNLNAYYPVPLKRWRLEQLKAYDTFRFTEGELGDMALLEGIFEKASIDVVVNLAARAGVRPSIEYPALYMETNAVAVVGLMQVMLKHSCRKLVLASTSSLYAGQRAPFHEEQAVDRPLSPYAASKKAAEVMAFTYHHLHGLDVSIVRYFTVYGPAGRPDMSPLKFTHCIATGQSFPLYGDGSQCRDFTYIDDIARGTIAAMRPLGYEIINLGGGCEPVTIKGMICELEDLLGKKALIEHYPRNEADMDATSADISKAARLLDWRPQTSFKEGMSELAHWYQAESAWLGQVLDGAKG